MTVLGRERGPFAGRCPSGVRRLSPRFRRVAIVNRGEAAVRADPRGARAQPRARLGDADDRAAHRGRAAGDVRARGRRGRADRAGRAPTSTTASSSGRSARAAPTPPGWDGASSPRTPPSPSCALASASSSSVHRPTSSGASATRPARSCSPSRRACGSDAGTAAEDAAVPRRASRRGPGHRRPPRRRLGRRRARLLDPARQPEADRGVELAGARRRAGGRAAGRGRRPGPGRPAIAAPAPSSSSIDADEHAFAFIGFTACLQAEHAVTEMTTGLDLVKLQIHVAGGGHLEGEPPTRVRPRDRGPAQRRGPRTRLRPRARDGRAAHACPPGRGSRRDRRRRGRRHLRPSTTR